MKSVLLYCWLLIFGKNNYPVYRTLRRTTICLLIYSTIVTIAEMLWSPIFKTLQVENLSAFHLIFNFVLALLVSFRVNASYSRWWEARGYWGLLVNNSRNLAMKFNNYIGFDLSPEFLNYLKIFPNLLKFHLRKEKERCEDVIKTVGLINLPIDSHLPSAIVNDMYRIINKYRTEGKILIEQYLVLDQHLVSLIDIVGGCEKIANTPIPSAFKAFVRRALVFYMIIFPFGWVGKFGFLIIPILIVIVDILLGLELVSEDIERPFANNYFSRPENLYKLDLDTIAETIAKNVQSIAEQHSDR